MMLEIGQIEYTLTYLYQ